MNGVLSLQINPPEGSEFTFGTQAAGIGFVTRRQDCGLCRD